MNNNTKNIPTVLIGCPINHQREWVVQYYLDHLYKINYPKTSIHLAFLYNYPKNASNEDIDNTLCFLRKFKQEHESKYKKISIWEATTNYEDSRVKGRRFDIFARLRNEWLSMRTDEDYIFSIDSDILVPIQRDANGVEFSSILTQMIDWNKPVVAALIYNGKTLGNMGDDAFNFMSRLDETHPDGSNIYIHRPSQTLQVNSKWERDKKPPYLWRCVDIPTTAMSGAVMLIRKDVLDAGVSFSHHQQGEDVGFCEDVKDKGFDVFIDWQIQPHHIMHPGQLNQYLNLPPGLSVVKPSMDVVKPSDVFVDIVKKE
jgi:hypothetical protein